jgi:signal transduction histidine kinase
MRDLGPRPGSSSRVRLPRRTARLRLTLLYGGTCLVFGGILLTVTYLLTWGAINLSAVPQPAAASGQSPAAQQSQSGNLAGQITVDRQLLLTRSGIALVIVSAAAVGAGWLLAGRVLRPLSTITVAARRMSAGSLHERLALPGPDDELKELGDTLDGLLARLEASFDAQRRFAANASHELRTPLTRERALIEVTRADPAATAETWQEVSRNLLAFSAETERLIDALLTLASSEAGLGQPEPLDLAAITGAALAVSRPGISRLGLDVRTDIQPASLDGDPLLVQQMVANLIDNAVHHNIPGGNVQVSTRTTGGHAILSVTNSGQEIPPAEVSRLLQPFQRLGPRRAHRDGGHGLGLAIVKAIATAHDAVITPGARPGGGLTIEITFPGTTPSQNCQARAEMGDRSGLSRQAPRIFLRTNSAVCSTFGLCSRWCVRYGSWRSSFSAGGVRSGHRSSLGPAAARLPGPRLSPEVPNGRHDPLDFSSLSSRCSPMPSVSHSPGTWPATAA